MSLKRRMERQQMKEKLRLEKTDSPVTYVEKRIPIKKKTAENIARVNQEVTQKADELQQLQKNLEMHIMPLLTEAGVEAGRVVQVTEKPPYELVVQLPKLQKRPKPVPAPKKQRA